MKTVSRHLEISVNKPKTMPTYTIHSSAKRQKIIDIVSKLYSMLTGNIYIL